MRPILFTVPGVLFKLVVPALVLWGLYSLIVGYERAARRRLAGNAETPAPKLPADSPANALIAVLVGVGVFLYAAPVTVAQGNLLARLASAVRVFATSVIQGRVWGAAWAPLPVYAYGVMLGTSLIVGWFITIRLAARAGIAREVATDTYLVTAFAAIVGARVLYVLTNLSTFRDPVTHRLSLALLLSLRTGGLVAYGGFLGGLIGSVLILRVHKRPFWPWSDAAVVSLGSGLMITRIGCYLYGCDFGRPLSPTAPSWLVRIGTFPRWSDDRGSPAWLEHRYRGVAVTASRCVERIHGDFHDGLCFLDPHAARSIPVHPTQLYESLLGAALLVVMASMWRRGRRFDGQVFLAFGVLYGVGRSVLEIVRGDEERGMLHGWSTSQIIGITSAVVCGVLYVMRARRAAQK